MKNDVDCVVHAINNAVGFPLLAKHQVERDLAFDFDPEVGFTPEVVVKYVRQTRGIYFKRVPQASSSGRYIIEVAKPTYNHMIALVNGRFKDNELKIHYRIGSQDKIVQIYKLIN